MTDGSDSLRSAHEGRYNRQFRSLGRWLHGRLQLTLVLGNSSFSVVLWHLAGVFALPRQEIPGTLQNKGESRFRATAFLELLD